MSDLRKAAEMALDALNWHFDNEDDYLNWKYPLILESKQALRQALAQPEQEPVKEPFNSKAGVKEAFNLDRGCWERGCMAYDTRDCDEGVTIYVDAVNMSQKRVDETAKREHEPVAWFIQYEYRHEFLWRKPNELEQKTAFEIKPLYTAPPKQWVGLTDDEINSIDGVEMKYIGTGEYVIDGEYEFARAIEAKLKEKNT